MKQPQLQSISASANQPTDLEGPMSPMGWVRLIAGVGGFNAALAVGLWASGMVSGNVGGALLYSESIGLSIFAIHALLACVPIPGRRFLKMLFRLIFSVPIGYSIGIRIAAALLGDDVTGMRLSDLPRFELSTTALATVCVVYFFWSRDRLHQEVAAHARADALASEAQLRLLRAQIEPHMLFNTLANLRSLVESDSARAQHMLDQLIVFLRASLSASRTETRMLESELDQLRAYLELMKIRMADRLEYRIDAAEALGQLPVPAMLIQPLVENAIKHGLEPSVIGGTLSVSVALDAGALVIVVADTGVGWSDHAIDGYGLTHIRDRLAVLYGAKATLGIDPNQPSGVRATITMPMPTGVPE